MKALFIDRKGFSKEFDIPSPAPREWTIEWALPITQVGIGLEDFLVAPKQHFERQRVEFEFFIMEETRAVYREKLPAVASLREHYESMKKKLKPSKKLKRTVNKRRKKK